MKHSNLTKEDIKTFEDACNYLGYNAETVIPDFSATAFPQHHAKAMEAHAKLVIIAEVLNRIENNGKPWAPDWQNGKWDKYYPWFEMGSPSGSDFAFHDDCAYWRTYSNCGSRLCFKTEAAAVYAGEQFEDLYKAYFVV